MKKLLVVSALLCVGCVNMPKDEVTSSSGQKLCDHATSPIASADSKEAAYKELERRGLSCRPAYANLPPPVQPQRKTRTITNCQEHGNQVNCTTY